MCLDEIQRPVARVVAQRGLARAAAAVEFPPVWMPGGRGPAFRPGCRSGGGTRGQWEARGDDRQRVGNLRLTFRASRLRLDLVPSDRPSLGLQWIQRFPQAFRSALRRGVFWACGARRTSSLARPQTSPGSVSASTGLFLRSFFPHKKEQQGPCIPAAHHVARPIPWADCFARMPEQASHPHPLIGGIWTLAGNVAGVENKTRTPA